MLYNVDDPADRVQFRLYTRAYRLIMDINLTPAASGPNNGYISAALFNGYAEGAYFYVIIIKEKDGTEKHGKIGEVLIFR